MGLFTGAPIGAEWKDWDDRWFDRVDPPVSAGVPTDPDAAMRVSAVFACVRLISRSVGLLALHLYERVNVEGSILGGKRRAPNHPLYRTLHARPNPQQTSYEFREYLTRSVLLRGNGYAEILSGTEGFGEELRTFHPSRVTPELLESGRIRYRIRPRRAGEPERVLTQDQVLHLRDLSEDGVTGRGVVQFARESVGLAAAQEMYAARYFSQGARPGVVIKHPKTLSKDAHERMQDSWQESHGGLAGAHKPAIIEEGSDVTSLGMSNEDAQWLESRKFSVADMARWFGLPSHAINDLERATFSNIEQLQIFLVTFGLMPYLTLWEQTIARDLLVDPEKYFAEFLVDSLLRGDVATRSTAYGLYVQNGIMAENEVRVRENLNPWPGLDEPRRSANQDRGGDPQGPRPGSPERQAQDDEEDADEPDARARRIAAGAIERAIRREHEAVRTHARRHAADPEAWRQWVDEFYARHAAYLSEALALELPTARGFALDHRAALLAEGVSVLDTWETTAGPELTRLAIGECHAR